MVDALRRLAMDYSSAVGREAGRADRLEPSVRFLRVGGAFDRSSRAAVRACAFLALLLVVAAPTSIVAAQGHGAPPTTQIVVGADRLLGEFAHLITGKRLALVTNHSGRLADGSHLADALFRLPGAPLRVLFAMDHDIRSNDYAAPRDGERAIDATTGLVKYNLYGERHRPTREMFGDAEVVVFDIQERWTFAPPKDAKVIYASSWVI